MSNLATIEEAFEFVRNGVSIKQLDGASGIPITRIETIWNTTIDDERFGYANIEDVEEYKNHLLEDGDILMSHINSPKHLGKCAIYRNKPEVLIHGMNLLNLRPKKNILVPQFAFYYLSSNSFKEAITKISNQSVNQASFSTTNLKKLKIPLPPLAEQQKIAAILDAADSLRQKDQQLVERYSALSQSLFLEMFGDPVTNLMGWDFSKISNLISDKTINGFFAKKEHYDENGTPIVWISDFIDKVFVATEGLKKVNLSTNDISKYKLRYGDALFCRSSLTVEGIGKCSIVPKLIHEEIVFECHIIKVSFGNSIIPEYFRFLSNTAYFRGEVMKSAKTSTMTTISQEGITNIFIPVPPVELQNQFAERIQLIEAQKQQAQRSLEKSEALFNSLLQRAFTGELTAKMAA